jgi:hypothetical protein
MYQYRILSKGKRYALIHVGKFAFLPLSIVQIPSGIPAAQREVYNSSTDDLSVIIFPDASIIESTIVGGKIIVAFISRQ